MEGEKTSFTLLCVFGMINLWTMISFHTHTHIYPTNWEKTPLWWLSLPKGLPNFKLFIHSFIHSYLGMMISSIHRYWRVFSFIHSLIFPHICKWMNEWDNIIMRKWMGNFHFILEISIFRRQRQLYYKQKQKSISNGWW